MTKKQERTLHIEEMKYILMAGVRRMRGEDREIRPDLRGSC